MYFARERRIVSADRQKRDFNVVALADFFESLEIRTVAAVKNGAPIRADDKAAEAAMSIGEKARAPMMRGRERDPERTELDRLPFIEFVHDIETEPVHQTPDPDRNDNRLIGRDFAQCSAIEMIEMRVCHEHEVDRRQVMNMKARFFDSLDHAEPHRPDRID